MHQAVTKRKKKKILPTDRRIRDRKRMGKPIEIKVSRDWEVRKSVSRMRHQLNTLSLADAKAMEGPVASEPIKDLFMYARASQPNIVKTCLDKLNGRVGSLKVEVNVLFHQPPPKNEFFYHLFPSHGFTDVPPNTRSVLNFYNTAIAEITKDIEEFNKHGSGSVFINVESIYVTFVGYPTKSPKGAGWVFRIPYKMRGLFDVVAPPNECIKWSYIASRWSSTKKYNRERFPHWQQFEKQVNFEGVPFPTPDESWEVIDKQNPETQLVVWLAVGPWDQFDAEKSQLKIVRQYPYGPMPLRPREQYVHTVKVESPDKSTAHYLAVSDIALVLPRTTDGHKRHLCRHCWRVTTPLNPGGIRQMAVHERSCTGNNSEVNLPIAGTPDALLQFHPAGKLAREPEVAYGDFEAHLVSNGFLEKFALTEKTLQGMTTRHVLSGGRYVIIGADKKVLYNREAKFKPTGPDAHSVLEDGKRLGREFLQQVIDDCKKIKALRKESSKMELTEKEQADFDEATHCHICKEAFAEHDVKVRDHDHTKPPGQNYRGAAHNSCNLNYTCNGPIPMFMHNSKNYDSHFLMQALVGLGERPAIIPANQERYMSMTLGKLVTFRDSCLHLPAALDKLVKDLKDSNYGFPITRDIFKGRYSEDIIDELINKGSFLYNYWDHPDKRNVGFPPWEFWKKEGRSKKDYERGLKMYIAVGCKNLGDYHDIYLEPDVYLLADVFEFHRDVMINTTGLDPAHYITLPSHGKDMWLRHCQLEGQKPIELLTKGQEDILLKLETMKRGGYCGVHDKYFVPNNPGVPNFDPTKPTTWGFFGDVTNLYGAAQTYPLPCGNFHWDPRDWTNTEEFVKWIKTVPPDAKEGYFPDVSGYFPDNCHDRLRHLPPLMLNRLVDISELPPWQQKQNPNLSCEKLVADLLPKIDYMLDYRMLQFAMELGFVVTEVHAVLAFEQDYVCRSFVEEMAKKRREATTDAERDKYKAYVVSNAGKFLEDVRKRTECTLTFTDDDIEKKRRWRNLDHAVPFSDDCVAMFMTPREPRIRQPIAMGVAIYELSKLIMLNLFYKVLQPLFGVDNIALMYMDTDSLMLKITCPDLEAKLEQVKEHFDFSEVKEGSFLEGLRDPTNHKVLGTLKDETAGVLITKVVALAPKLYAYATTHELKEGKGTVKKKSKGVPRDVVEKDINIDQYEEVLFTQKKLKVSDIKAQNREKRGEDDYRDKLPTSFRSVEHEIYTVEQDKIALSPVDTKRYWVNETESLPFGHYRTRANAAELRSFAQQGCAIAKQASRA